MLTWYTRRRERWRPRAVGRRRGFTILEILVAVAISAILAVAVFPRFQRWLGQADAARSASDLTALRTAIQVFEVNVRRHPSRLSHLTVPIRDTDLDLDGDPYGAAAAARWKGPYLNVQLPDAELAEAVLELPSGGSVGNQVQCFDPETAALGCVPNSVIVILTGNVIGADYELINDVIDGDDEPTGTGLGQSRSAGKLQYIGGGVSLSLTIGTMIYFIGPYAP